MNKDRSLILKAIEQALQKETIKPAKKPDFNAPIYDLNEKQEDLAILFAKNLKNVQGEFCYCIDEQELLDNLRGFLKNRNLSQIFVWETRLQKMLEKAHINFHKSTEDLRKIEVGVTSCEYLVARTGSVVISSRQAMGRALSIFPSIHIVVSYTSQLVYDIGTALRLFREKHTSFPSMLSFITGPSRTADIEKTLVLGAHGPQELHVFLIDDQL